MGSKNNDKPATRLQLSMLAKYMKAGYIKKDLETLGELTRYEAGLLILQAHGIMRLRNPQYS